MAYDPYTFKNTKTGERVHVTKMDDRWLINLYKWFEKNGKANSDPAKILLAEINRRNELGIRIAETPEASARPNTAPPVRATATPNESWDIIIQGVNGGQINFARIGDNLAFQIADSATHSSIVAADRKQVVGLALSILNLFNDQETIALLAQQLNKAEEANAQQVQRTVATSMMEDEEVW